MQGKKNTDGSWVTIGERSNSMEIDGYVRVMTRCTWLIQHPANEKNALELLSQGAAGLCLLMLYNITWEEISAPRPGRGISVYSFYLQGVV